MLTIGGTDPQNVTGHGQEVLSMVHQKEEVQRLKNRADAQPDHLKTQWKKQVSSAATYKTEIRALHAELQNMTEKSELKATLSARVLSFLTTRPIVESEPEVLFRWSMLLWITMDSTKSDGEGHGSHLDHRAHRHSVMI